MNVSIDAATVDTRVAMRDNDLFGLNYSRLVEGAAVVGDDITITLDIEATKKAS